jgi:hypothetical protein
MLQSERATVGAVDGKSEGYTEGKTEGLADDCAKKQRANHDVRNRCSRDETQTWQFINLTISEGLSLGTIEGLPLTTSLGVIDGNKLTLGAELGLELGILVGNEASVTFNPVTRSNRRKYGSTWKFSSNSA